MHFKRRKMCIRRRFTYKQLLQAVAIFLVFECYINTISYVIHDSYKRKYLKYNTEADDTYRDFLKFCANITIKTSTDLPHKDCYYEYPLINSTNVSMNYNNGYNSSYYWFISMKPYFKKLGDEGAPTYTKDTPVCQVDLSNLGPILVEKVIIDLEWVEKLNPDVKTGGTYAPAHCRPINRVAIIVPYRNRRINLIIFLRYIHPLLKKQELYYRIFLIEQLGTEKFNKGSLYNIAFLETQRFGTWDCLVFHDVDLVPEHEGIPYSCNEHPTHMSPAVEMFDYELPYDALFGGVTSLTPAQYEAVNGYSNCYWNWGAEDDDMQRRLKLKNYTISRYNSTIARYATLPHLSNEIGKERNLFLMLTRLLYIKEGLATTKYRLIKVTEKKLFTHILADVNPTKLKLDTKSLMHHVVSLHGNSLEYGRQELQLKSISAAALHEYLARERNRKSRLLGLKDQTDSVTGLIK